MKPVTYMNLSGNSVSEVVNFYGVDISKLVVVHDDIDLPLGRIRIKRGSSSGGHRGVESIINVLSSKNFIRVRMGVGKEDDPARYVLKKFDLKKATLVKKFVDLGRDAVISIIKDGLEKAMNKFNGILGVEGSERV